MPSTPRIGEFFDLYTPLFQKFLNSEYLNLGFWNPGDTDIPQAQENLAKALGEFSNLKEGCRLLDVGFGTGEQDLYFAKHFKCKKIVGINISNQQVEIAKRKIPASYKNKIQFKKGNALDLRYEDEAQFDRVLALECSHQFLDKSLFFEGAFHVLKKLGLIGIAEPVHHSPEAYSPRLIEAFEAELTTSSLEDSNIQTGAIFAKQLLENEMRLKKQYPRFNLYLPQTLELLANAGFQSTQIQDITEQLLPFYQNFKRAILSHLKSRPSEADKLVFLLAIFFLRHQNFLQKSSGFYLIKSIKY